MCIIGNSRISPSCNQYLIFLYSWMWVAMRSCNSLNLSPTWLALRVRSFSRRHHSYSGSSSAGRSSKFDRSVMPHIPHNVNSFNRVQFFSEFICELDGVLRKSTTFGWGNKTQHDASVDNFPITFVYRGWFNNTFLQASK